MAEDEFWLDHSDDEDKEETAHMCLMGKDVKYDESDEETSDEFDLEKLEFVLKVHKLHVENKSLEKKVNGLEVELYARGQTDQIIFLNTPNEDGNVKEKWGLGYDNPHYLKKAIIKQPTLYNFDFQQAAKKHPHLKPKFVTKSSDEVEAKEEVNRKNITKMQLPFFYQKAPQTSEDDINDLFACANDFLNSDDGCIDESIDMFDFNAKLPDHSTFIINSEVLPSVFEVGESSTKDITYSTLDSSVTMISRLTSKPRVCEKGKMKRAAHKPMPDPSTSSPFALLHMDLCGPMRTRSINGKKYVLVIMDDYSRYTL
ncbi:hypothetical protein L6452_15189 [Arctium lappa]|uniref:Uncharacterized protein n=1 Tax=Arctium lappa TaxID=4217 RepID=A0ACB9CN75_ARCLA|nr:hypothetical protein L6452_15189 [Arctium lappa]